MNTTTYNVTNAKRIEPTPYIDQSREQHLKDIAQKKEFVNQPAEVSRKATTSQRIDTKNEIQHSFHVNRDYISGARSGGEVIVNAGKNLAEDRDDMAYAGVHEIKQQTDLPYNIMVANGANAELRRLQHKYEHISYTTDNAKELIASQKLSLSDLRNKDSLLNKLNENGVSVSLAKEINTKREVIYTNISTRDSLLDFNSQNEGIFTSKELDLIDSGSMFNPAKAEQCEKIISKYFSKHENEILRKTGVTRLNEKNLNKLIKEAPKLGLSDKDVCLLKKLTETKKLQKLQTNFHSKHTLSVLRMVQKLREQFGDDLSNTGLDKIQQVGNGVLLLKSIAQLKIREVSWVDNHTLKLQDRAKQAIERQRQKKAQTKPQNQDKEKSKPKSTKENSKKTSQKSSVEQKKDAKLKSTATSKKQNKKKNAQIITKQKKFANRAFDIISSPFELISRGFNLFAGAKEKISVVFYGFIVVFILIYIFAMLLSSLFLSINSLDLDTVAQTPLVDEKDMMDMIEHVKKNESTTYDEANKMGTTPPQNTYVDLEKKLYRYGSQSGSVPSSDIWHNHSTEPITGGYKIYYIDSSGQIIDNYNGITKDVICIATALLNNNYPMDEDSNLIDNTSLTSLLDDIYSLIMPGIVSEESNIYYCAYGCDTMNYLCSDTDFYNNGITKYGLLPYSQEGCQTSHSYHNSSDIGQCTNYDEDNYFCTTSSSDSPTCSNSYSFEQYRGSAGTVTLYKCGGHTTKTCLGHEDNYCNGHTCRICYGHKDITIYIPIIAFSEIIEAAKNKDGVTYKTPDGKTYKTISGSSITEKYPDLLTDFHNGEQWNNKDLLAMYQTYMSQNWNELYGISGNALRPRGGS